MNYVGIIPAAGLASRLGPLGYPKELLPITYVQGEGGHLRPLPVIEASLRQLRTADITRCMVVTSERKPELAQYLGSGGAIGLDIAYVQQSKAEGLAAAVALTVPWTRGSASCLLLPDTIVRPLDALKTMREAFESRGADLVLGVFPSERPKELGPVRFDADGKVTEVQDKPAQTDLANSWGLAIWGDRFSEMIAAAPPNANLGLLFHQAAQNGLNVIACWFEDGQFHDVGTPKGLAEALPVLMKGL
jgi:glucose-1-phosphate thymidylyltransferase